jgi:multiple sugar transport system substrate-binding protein
MMKKLILAAALALAASIPCFAQKGIVFWVRDSDQGFVDPLVKAYNAKAGTQVKLTIIPSAQFVTKFATSIAGGSPPDVVATDLVYLPAFSSTGQMTDITERAKALPFFDKLSPSHIRLSTWEGKLYSVPFSAEASVLVYNKNLFQQAGLDANKPPANFAEIQDDAKRITDLGGNTKGFYFSGTAAGGMVFTAFPLIWASGGDILSEDGKTANVNQPAVRDTLELYRTIWTSKWVPEGAKTDSGTNFFTAFATGKVGMTALGAFSIGLLTRDYPKIDFGVTPLPGKTGGSASFAGGDCIGIPKGSKNVDEAWKFIQWCLQEDTQINYFAKNGSIPVRTDLSSNEYSKLDPRYLVVSEMMDKGRTPYTVKYNELFNDANEPWLALFQDAVFGKDVDEAIKKAQERFNKILEER